MKRALLMVCASLLLLTAASFAQRTGSLTVTVKRAPESGTTAGPVSGAKVMVVHWTNDGMNPTIFQDQIATTNQVGTCTVELPPGTYDVFIAASELGPVAFRREIKAGQTTSLAASLKPAPTDLKPVR